VRSHRELLDADNKFFCNGCNSYQEAQKWVDIKKAPPVLIFHLNRLGFMHHLGRERKLKHRVVFDQRITLPNLAAGASGVDDEYDLFAVIAHVGAGAHHGAHTLLSMLTLKRFHR
jgi:ubiquitin C-terminal hydrolase